MTRGGPVKPARGGLPPPERVLVLLHAQLVQRDVVGLLLPDVLGDRRLVQPDGHRAAALGPEPPVPELVLQVRVLVEHHQRAFLFQAVHRVRRAALRGHRRRHARMVGHEAPLHHLDPLALAQPPQDPPASFLIWL